MAKSKSDVKKGNEVTEAKPAAVMEAVPDFMKGQAGAGLEQLGAGDFEIPRIKLIQMISPEVMDFGAKPGNFWHTIAEEDLGPKLDVVPLYITKSAILWRPREDGGGILARAMDGETWVPAPANFSVKINKGTKQVTWRTVPSVAQSGLLEWGTFDPDDPKSQPAGTLMYNMVAQLRDYPELSPVVFTFQRSAIRVARKFIGKLKLSQAPIYGRRFEVSSIKDTGGGGQDFLNYALTGTGFVQDSAEFKQYEELYRMFVAQGVKIKDIDTLQEESETAAAGGGEPQEGDPRDGKPAY